MLCSLYTLVDDRTECKPADGAREKPIKDVAHPRRPRQGQGLGPQARSPEGVAGRFTARRQGGTRSGASSSWASRRVPHSRLSSSTPLHCSAAAPRAGDATSTASCNASTSSASSPHSASSIRSRRIRATRNRNVIPAARATEDRVEVVTSRELDAVGSAVAPAGSTPFSRQLLC